MISTVTSSSSSFPTCPQVHILLGTEYHMAISSLGCVLWPGGWCSIVSHYHLQAWATPVSSKAILSCWTLAGPGKCSIWLASVLKSHVSTLTLFCCKVGPLNRKCHKGFHICGSNTISSFRRWCYLTCCGQEKQTHSYLYWFLSRLIACPFCAERIQCD